MLNIILHIGLHKTGTTTLQQQFFPACSDLHYLSGPSICAFTQGVIATDPIYYDPAAGRSLVNSCIRDDVPNLISRESFSGSLYAGVGCAGLDHRSPILDNLSAALPEARAIIVLRRQDGLARSIYREYLKMGGTKSMREFYGLGLEKKPVIPINRFRFSSYLDRVMSSFPSGVLVLTFEEFIHHQTDFLRKLVKFIGVGLPDVELRQSNKTSFGPAGLEVSRFVGRLFQSQLNPGGLVPQIPVYRRGHVERINPMRVLHDRWPIRGNVSKRSQFYKVSQEIFQSVHDDNRVMDERCNIGLAKFNYY